MNKDMPKIYGNGDVTICLSCEGIRLFVSQTEILHIHQVKVISNSDKLSELEIKFDQEADKKAVEEEIRVCSLVPYIKITR
jgi:hypothetical protein